MDTFVEAVPNIPVFVELVGRIAHDAAVDDREELTGPAEVKPPDPLVKVAVPEPVSP